MFYSEFRTFLKLKYPVYESDQESWSRYEEIYRLTTNLAEKCQAKPKRCLDLEESWENLAVFWSCYSTDMCGSDLMFETLYHICFRKFSEKTEDPTLMRLILLIEDELLSFSYAFKVWLQTIISKRLIMKSQRLFGKIRHSKKFTRTNSICI